MFEPEDEFGNTPLLTATLNLRTTEVEVLLKKGANVNHTNREGKTALHLAMTSHEQHLLITKALLEKGANANALDNSDMSPTAYAVIQENKNLVTLLLSYGADINYGFGKSPLNLACTISSLDMVILLLKNGTCNKIGKKMDKITRLHILVELLNWDAPFGCYFWKRLEVVEQAMKCKCADIQYKKICDSDACRWLASFREKCLKELNEMRTQTYRGQSFKDVFTKYHTPRYVFNSELEAAIMSPNCELNFPIYGSLLWCTFIKAKHRKHAIEKSKGILKLPVPDEIADYILSYLNDDDIEKIVSISS